MTAKIGHKDPPQATKMIPKGFTATDVYVYTNVSITGGVDVSEGNIATVVVSSNFSKCYILPHMDN